MISGFVMEKFNELILNIFLMLGFVYYFFEAIYPFMDKISGFSNFKKKQIYLFLFLTMLPLFVSAQNEQENSISNPSDQGLANAIKTYKDAIGNNSMIMTGSYYNDTNSGIGGHPFYMINIWTTGTVVYEGQRYDNMEIRYDIYDDIILIKYIDQQGRVRPIQLQSSKVEEFIMMDHHFIHIVEDTSSVLNAGFFDLLHAGENATLLAKRRKEISRTSNIENLVKEYYENDKWYVKFGHNYYEIKSKKSLLEVFSERKDEVKVYLKKNKAAFRKDQEKQFKEAVQYYNSLTADQGS